MAVNHLLPYAVYLSECQLNEAARDRQSRPQSLATLAVAMAMRRGGCDSTSLLLNESVDRQLNGRSLLRYFPAEFLSVEWKPPALTEIKYCLTEQLHSNSSRLIKNIL